MDENKIIAFLSENPGSIAEEIGATSIEMNRLFKKGAVIKLGTRAMNRRGRPPFEWAVTGQEGVTQDERVSDALAAARERMNAHHAYEASSAHLSAVRISFGLGSPEHLEAKAAHKEQFPTPPPIPGGSDYALMGLLTEANEVAA